MPEDEVNTDVLKVTGDERMRQNPLNPGPSSVGGQLPSGYVDPATGEVYRDFVIREMRGREEKVLAGNGMFVTQMIQVIINCLESLGPIVDKQRLAEAVNQLPLSDIEAMTLTLRRLSLGDDLWLEPTCPIEDCGVMVREKVNLGDLEMKPIADPMQHHVTSVLRSGREVKWHVMRAMDAKWIASLPKKELKAERFNIMLLGRIESVDGQPLNRLSNGLKRSIEQLDDWLSYGDRREFDEIINAYEGDMDKIVIFDCKACGHEWSLLLPVMHKHFFSLSGI